MTTLVSASTSIPGPRALPMIGYLAQLMRFFGDPIAYMRTASQTYGPVVALAANDSHGFFEREGGLLRTGPTGTNVRDLVLVSVLPRAGRAPR